MANAILSWPTTNGNTLSFTAYSISTTFGDNQFGNYIFAKFNNTTNQWLAVYIGEGDIKCRTEEHIKNNDVVKCGATHIFVRINSNEKERFDDETKLLIGNPEAYHPKGCNVKKGG